MKNKYGYINFLVIMIVFHHLVGCNSHQFNASELDNSSPPDITPTSFPTFVPVKELTILPTITTMLKETSTPPNKNVWMVPSRELIGWPKGASWIWWQENHILRVSEFAIEDSFVYDLMGDSLDVITKPLDPTSTPFRQANPNNLVYSPDQRYVVLCSNSEELESGEVISHTMRLYDAQKGLFISQVDNVSLDCGFHPGYRTPISWARDETVLSFTTIRTNMEQDPLPIDIYVWKTDGTKPFLVGKGVYAEDAGTWSPDGKRMVVELGLAYRIYELDQRTSKEITTFNLEERLSPGLEWFTDDILLENGHCCVTCKFTSYYLADTGDLIDGLSWQDCSPSVPETQPMELSGDRRWAVVEQTKGTDYIYGEEKLIEFKYGLVDLVSKQVFELSSSTDVMLDFVGWDIANTFYLVSRPVNGKVVASKERPFGLYSLIADSRSYKLLTTDIDFAWMNPTKEFFLGATKLGGKFKVAVYDMNGTRLGTSVEMVMPDFKEAFMPGLNIWDTPSTYGPLGIAWSHDGEKVVVRDWQGTIWLADINGMKQKLAINLDAPNKNIIMDDNPWKIYTRGVFWSPHDDYIIICTGSRAWVVGPL